MFSKLFSIFDRVTNVYEPVFEARTIDQVQVSMSYTCEQLKRDPNSFSILELGQIERREVVNEESSTIEGSLHITIYDESIEHDVLVREKETTNGTSI